MRRLLSGLHLHPPPRVDLESIFGIRIDFLRAAKGGLFLMKKSLEAVLLVCSNSENAIADGLRDIEIL
jgi:hypothetical protein